MSFFKKISTGEKAPEPSRLTIKRGVIEYLDRGNAERPTVKRSWIYETELEAQEAFDAILANYSNDWTESEYHQINGIPFPKRYELRLVVVAQSISGMVTAKTLTRRAVYARKLWEFDDTTGEDII